MTTQALLIDTFLNHKPPQDGERYESPVPVRVPLVDANGLTHDLVMLSFHTRQHLDNRCGSCGVSVLAPLTMHGLRLCSHCYEQRYEELGGGD